MNNDNWLTKSRDQWTQDDVANAISFGFYDLPLGIQLKIWGHCEQLEKKLMTPQQYDECFAQGDSIRKI